MIHASLSPLVENTRPSLVAMIHVRALPGTPAFRGAMAEIVAAARDEARVLAEAGADALLIENMHDAPYVNGDDGVGPEVGASMTVVGLAVREEAPKLPLGVQILAGANQTALAVAQACGASFIRAEGFVFGHLGDEGYHNACAGDLLRYRRAIGAEDIAVLADIKKKHSAHAITADVDLAETARAAEFFRADGVIVTGTSTGATTCPEDLAEVCGATSLPVAIGSGVTAQSAANYAAADLLIVGSAIKEGGRWDGPLSPERTRELADAISGLRKPEAS